MDPGNQAPDREPAPDPVELDAAIDAAVDGVPVGTTNACSDTRNAERLIEWFGPNLRHVPKWNKWLTWDRARWTESPQRALAAAVQTARMMLDEATTEIERAKLAFEDVRTHDEEDDERKDAENKLDRAEKAYSWAARSQNRNGIHAMLDVAATHKDVETFHEALDQHPLKLNVANGTIDLVTGELGPHIREDLFTMVAPVAFDSTAKCPTWDAFLERAMAGDRMMILYLQRIAGYLLTGSVKEHALFFFYGGGANGKTTFTNTLMRLLGDELAGPMPRDMLFAKSEHATREASLFRRRLAVASEVGEGKRLDESFVKDITGGDVISARRMREDFWSFFPTHKIVMFGNHKPIITGGDDGIWRRIRLIPWLVQIPEAERDQSLPEKLAAELPGILNWAIAGCLEWQRIGLTPPESALEATSTYRAEQDSLGEFFAMLEFGPDHPEFRVTRAKLRATYEAWCEEEGRQPLGARRFTDRLREHASKLGVQLGDKMTKTYDQAYPVRAWVGVRIAVM
ncbi:MAG TPA: phage/plasmid primase, P4 family [Polyangiaceae bacterium]|jgi:putative DNA primase/helicase